MPHPDQWLKLHTSLLTSEKFTLVEDPRHRLIFIILMMFCKKAIIREGVPLSPGGRAGLRAGGRTSELGVKNALTALVKVGLIEENGWVIGFKESQLSKEAVRKRRQRERDSHGISHGTVTTEERREKKDKNPLSPPRGKSRPSVKKQMDNDAQLVLDHFNEVFNTNRTKETRNILAALRDGMTVDQCKLIVDQHYSQVKGWDPKARTAASNPTYPFRSTHRVTILNNALEAERNGSPDWDDTKVATITPEIS